VGAAFALSANVSNYKSLIECVPDDGNVSYLKIA